MLEGDAALGQNSRVKRTSAVPVLLVSALLATGLGCGRQTPRTQSRQESFTSRANFVPGDVRAFSAPDGPQGQQRATEEAPKVLSLLNSFYTAAFLDPKKWSGGTHPELPEFFSAESRPSIAPNLGALALAELAPRLRGLNSTKQDAPRISLLVDHDLSSPVGVVTAVFEAKATPARGKTPVSIVHNATFWLWNEGDAYRIYAYTTELRADSQVKSAAFGDQTGGVLK